MSTERGSGLGPGFGRPGPRREPGSRRSVLLPTLVTLGLLLLVLAIFTGVWTDRLWFESVGFSSVSFGRAASRTSGRER